LIWTFYRIEFHALFDRISKKIDLSGAGTVEEINARLRGAINEIRYQYALNPLGQLQAESAISPLQALIFGGFARRVIDEAIANPHGFVALTLKLGRQRAKEITAKRARRRPL
jgi:hypothetical protein